jgi:lysophospholipase L1-like esterase
MVHSDRTDSWVESTDAKGSQKKDTGISRKTASLALDAASLQDWTCPQDYYGTNDGCDCGCGVIDPDCNGDSTCNACDFYFCGPGGVYATLNHLCDDQAVKIMPVGDSITAGEHHKKPADENRTGYRRHLYENLTEGYHNVDFVGSQEHGKGHYSGYDYDSEAYPGGHIGGIAKALSTALKNDRPDVLLVHVGTNPPRDWDEKPGQVMDMLDMIGATPGKKPTWVLLCQIINQFPENTHTATKNFNIDVKARVKGGKDSKGKTFTPRKDEFNIIMVDMENGAGFNYKDKPVPLPDFENQDKVTRPDDGYCSDWSKCGDMWGTTYHGVSNDIYHPNDLGNRKMAWKFEEVLASDVLLGYRCD